MECDYHYRGELNEDELRELYSRIGSVFDSDDNDDELFHWLGPMSRDFDENELDVDENDDDFDYDTDDLE